MTADYGQLTVSIHKGKLPYLPFLELKNDILGEEFDLSVHFVDSKTAQKLNKQHRRKDYVPNTLSFPYSKTSGEIFLQLETIFSQAPEFEMSEQNYLVYIYIHSLLHILGLDHGPKMEQLEEKYLQKYATIKA